MRRDRLNDRFAELSSILEPGRPPKTDKVAILGDAVRMITQLRGEAQQLKESSANLQETINELKKGRIFVSTCVPICEPEAVSGEPKAAFRELSLAPDSQPAASGSPIFLCNLTDSDPARPGFSSPHFAVRRQREELNRKQRGVTKRDSVVIHPATTAVSLFQDLLDLDFCSSSYTTTSAAAPNNHQQRRRRTASDSSLSSHSDEGSRRTLACGVEHAAAETFLVTRLSLKL